MSKHTIKWDTFIFIGLLFIVAISPILIGASERTFYSPFISSVLQLSGGQQLEFFTTYKMWFIYGMTFIVSCLFFWKIKKFNIILNWHPIHFFLLLFLILSFFSTACSSYSYVAVFGQFNRAEGALMYSCYFVLFFIASQISLPKDFMKKIAIACSPILIINVILLTLEAIGINTLNLPIIKQLLQIPEQYTLNKNATIYGTLNQLNYLSAMFTMLAAFYIFYSLQQKHRLVYIAILLSMYGLLLSTSSIGYFVLTFILITSLIANLILKKWQHTLRFFSFIVLFYVMAFLLSFVNEEIALESIYFYKNPDIPSNTVEIKAAEPMEATTYEEFTLPTLPPSGHTALSSRVYIWEKTINVIQERPIIGYGLDTFIYEFPHFNIDSRKGISTENLIVDKPHNMYLGILYGTGTIGLLVFCSILYLIFHHIWRQRLFSVLPLIGASFAYLLCGVTIDTTLSLSTILWIFLGLSMNYQKGSV